MCVCTFLCVYMNPGVSNLGQEAWHQAPLLAEHLTDPRFIFKPYTFQLFALTKRLVSKMTI